MSEFMGVFREWVSTIREDVETLKVIVESETADAEARKYAAAALNYLLKRLDLVPDWEESIGVLDDVFAIRSLLSLATHYDLGSDLDTKTTVSIGRLTNEAHKAEEWLGAELYADLNAYFAKQVEESVRDRSPGLIVRDAAARKALFAEVDEDIRRIPAAPFVDAAKIELDFKSYIQHKLA